MKDSRAGEALWSEWTGNLYQFASDSAVVFCTIGHIDVSNEVVKRALASALQRDGITDSLGQAFGKIEGGHMSLFGYCGHVDGDTELTSCDMYGETDYGDTVEEVFPITWIEISAR